MIEKEFEFDVAFSFHSLDESLAVELNVRLQERFKTFIYLEQQKRLAGTNGEETFNHVFGSEARLVVVLYRQEWGETPFTRIEATAIRNRGFEHGYDFSLFIPTEKPPSTPKWLPKNRLYLGLERFGLDGAAAVIESRIEQAGGEPTIESVSDRGRRVSRALDLKNERIAFSESRDGVVAAKAAFDALLDTLQTEVQVLSEQQLQLSDFFIRQSRDWMPTWVLGVKGLYLHITWHNEYTNRVDEKTVRVELLDGIRREFGSVGKPRKLASMNFGYEITRPGYHSFVERGGNVREFTAQQLAEYLLLFLLRKIEGHQKER